MFIGHFALALAAKRAAPRASLGALVAAAQLVDLLWPVFLLLGMEKLAIHPGITAFNALEFIRYPYTHSLLTGFGWAALLGGGYFAITKYQRGAWVIAALVLSHWLLDYITHIPDLPLYPGNSPRLGLGLWNSIAGTLLVESILFAAGIAVYARATRARDHTGRIAFGAFVALLALFYFASIRAPLPPSADAVAYSALALWLFVPWAHWFDRHRLPFGSVLAATAQAGTALTPSGGNVLV